MARASLHTRMRICFCIITLCLPAVTSLATATLCGMARLGVNGMCCGRTDCTGQVGLAPSAQGYLDRGYMHICA